MSYRAWVIRHAKYRGLTGWVRNRTGGSVEAVFRGPMAMVEDMVTACHRGPALARVDAIDATPQDGEDWTGTDFAPGAGFDMRPTV